MNTPSHDQIAQLAHQLWLDNGQPEARSEEFWFEAERQLKASTTRTPATPPANPERLKAEAAAESVTDNYISPAPSQQEAIKAAIPNSGAARISPPPHKVTPAPKRSA